MRHNIILTVLTLTMSAAVLNAQATITNDLNLTIEAGETIHFTRTGYESGYETLESTIRLQVSYDGFLGGLGIDFPLGGEPGAMDVSLRAGYGLAWEYASLEAFGFLQRGMNKAPENMTLGGIGITGRLNITGPLWVFAEFRSMSPFFDSATKRYSYRYYENEACLTFGLSLKF